MQEAPAESGRVDMYGGPAQGSMLHSIQQGMSIVMLIYYGGHVMMGEGPGTGFNVNIPFSRVGL